MPSNYEQNDTETSKINIIMTFYDKSGTPRCYSEDFTHIYDYAGNPVAYIYNSRVWSYRGRYLGVLHNNWIVDKNGACVFFSENSTGGPVKPLRKLTPLKGLKKLRPLKSLRELPPLKPQPKLSWSNMNSDTFFNQ